MRVNSATCKKVTYPDDGSHNLWVAGEPLQGYGSLFHTISDGFLWERQGTPTAGNCLCTGFWGMRNEKNR
ncbi:MAG: hypothetical protein IH596_11065 [Bacteroidales bacterium]|nr:hypothetical protein [Bacteroidales bacterium]